ncbi:hypothetical protein KI387_036984, partial [Taxus chinensis]
YTFLGKGARVGHQEEGDTGGVGVLFNQCENTCLGNGVVLGNAEGGGKGEGRGMGDEED